MYCSDFDKAWEYGGTSMSKGPRLIFAIDRKMTRRTFRTLPLGATAAKIAMVRETYPYHHEEHPDKPVVLPNRSLPPGLRNALWPLDSE
jgi:hypothetical protein